ncbi:MAG: EI24 domain-containing protein [Marinifilaceae bacterium]
MIRDFFMTWRLFPSAVRILFSRAFRWYLLVPIVLIVLSFYGGNFVVGTLSDQLMERVREYMNTLEFQAPMLEKVSTIFVRIAVRITYVYLFLSIGGYIILVTMSPILSLLAEKTEKQVIGIHKNYGIKGFLLDIARGILLAVRNFVLQSIIMILLFFLSFFPMLGLVTPVLMFFVTSYFYGFAFMDYVMERQRKSVKEGVYIINRRIGIALALGIPFTLALSIPFIKIFVCGYLAMISVIIATIALKNCRTNDKKLWYENSYSDFNSDKFIDGNGPAGTK